jgi:hypothetical protein
VILPMAGRGCACTGATTAICATTCLPRWKPCAASRGVPHFEIAIFDVDADAALEARYNELVPVLTDERRTANFATTSSMPRKYVSI